MTKAATTLTFVIVIAVLVVFLVPVTTNTQQIGSIPVSTCNPLSLACNISNAVTVYQTCYETLGYHFLGFGGEICHTENGT